ncbi:MULTISPECIES: glycosyltransferase [unclassified Pseudoclavibacter]|uniref:glycosyltransferase n=1 Tax=unclassified Pseudoclavibacter TaxID=2615177 RepID=UPI00188B8716|nr:MULTISPECIES: glycosyltransferase [unclassified Pseudoclavibacter]MBF4457673.1 glycosyltransferase [Pseudoclavibacter sp. VKM Ac-2867]
MASLSTSELLGETSRTIRVASVPSGHVYVRHLAPVSSAPSSHQVVRLADPHPDGSGRPATDRWWPPVMLDSSWIDEHAAEFDVFHVHFGFDALSPESLRAIVDALGRHGKPLVYTVHDLTNPHHDTPDAHTAHLDILIPAADGLITLTAGAADEIERRWGRRPIVVPHPHIVEPDEANAAIDGRTASGGRFRVGVHAKSLRASLDPLPVIEALVDLSAREETLDVLVNGHRELLDPAGAKFEPELSARLRELADAGRIELRIHDYLSDTELWHYLASLDASVLPYRFGTHSGWMEACRDLGTAVVAPDVGYFADQGPVFEYRRDPSGTLDVDSLQAAVLAAARAQTPRPDPEARAAERGRIAAAHLDVYTSVLSLERVAS